jgi:ketosteroid isomerase-like protein
MLVPTSSTAVSREAALIRATRAQQDAAIGTRDIDRITTFWTEDVSIRRGLGQLFTGRVACRRLMESDVAVQTGVVYQREPSDIEVSPSWPLAFETGAWAGRLGSDEGPLMIAGRYSGHWVKHDGRRLIRSEVFVALTCAGEGCRLSVEPWNEPLAAAH